MQKKFISLPADRVEEGSTEPFSDEVIFPHTVVMVHLHTPVQGLQNIVIVVEMIIMRTTYGV